MPEDSAPGNATPIPSKRTFSISILASMLLVLGWHACAYSLSGDFAQYEGHLAIRGDYIYVMPGWESPCRKIEKNIGRVFWTWDFAGGARCGAPVFVDDHFYTMTLGGQQQSRLFRVDCERGRFAAEREFEMGCEFPAFVHTPILHRDLLIVVRDNYVRAIRLPDFTAAWEFSCQRKDLVWLHDYLHDGDRLYLLISGFVDTSSSYWDALHDQNLNKFEIVELDCRTGEVLNRFDKSIFPGIGRDTPGWTCFLGEWARKKLIALISKADDQHAAYRVFRFDPAEGSAMMLFEESEQLLYPGLYEATWYRHRPIVCGSAIFYCRDSSKRRPVVVARSLADGKILWKVEESRIPMACVGGKLYAYSAGWTYYLVESRDALTGALEWKTKLDRIDSHSRLYKMAESDGILYVLTGGHIRALDVADGKEIWKVRLRHETVYSQVPLRKLWYGIRDFFERSF